MGERHTEAREFDKTIQHSFDQTCTQGIQLDANSFDAYGIKREKNSEYTETDYSNGISITRFKEGDFAIGFPANYKHTEDKNGLSKITDDNGKAVAYLSADGNLLVAANDKVLQENKNAKVSLNETACYKKAADAKQDKAKQAHESRHERESQNPREAQSAREPEYIEMPELVITGRVQKQELIVMPEMVIVGRVPGHEKKDDRKDDKAGRTPKKAEPKPFNWDSDDPLEGIDVSGF